MPCFGGVVCRYFISGGLVVRASNEDGMKIGIWLWLFETGASRAMASDGILFFPLLGLSEDSHFQALALKLKQKMRLSQLHSLIEPSVARRKEGLCLHNKRMRVSKAKFLIQRGFGFDRLLETLLSKLSSSFAISEKALMGPRLSRCNCQVKDALKQDWNRRSRLRE